MASPSSSSPAMSKASSTSGLSSDETGPRSLSSSCDAASVGESAAVIAKANEAKQSGLAGGKAEPARPKAKNSKARGKGRASECDNKEASLEAVKVLVDKPGHRKEIRTTKSGRQYEMETRGVWTTIHSISPTAPGKTLRARLKERLVEWATFWPFVRRFIMEVLSLGRLRFGMYLLGSTIKGQFPTLHIFLRSRLMSIARTASETRVLRKKELFWVAITSYLSSVCERWMDRMLSDTKSILRRRIEIMANEHIMIARARLDFRTLAKPNVDRDFKSAVSFVDGLYRSGFVTGRLIDIFALGVSLCTQFSMLWSLTTAGNASLAFIIIFKAGVSFVRRFLYQRRYTWYKTITDKNYQRMRLMENVSRFLPNTYGECKVLGLPDWVTKEYKKASDALGDVSFANRDSHDVFETMTEELRDFTSTAVYVLFALKASSKPVGEATMSMTSLRSIQNAVESITTSIRDLHDHVRHFGRECLDCKTYYRILEIKPTIIEPVVPVEYSRTSREIKPTVSKYIQMADTWPLENDIRSGMDIEFRNVSYTWPGKRDKALDGLSFHVQAGQLCAIIGYNGAGKSTLIALIARLIDPSSGQILINGQDIKNYRVSDLHQAMTMLFQFPAQLPLPIREFIGIGNLAEVDNMEQIRAAATKSGAIEFVEKLKDGFESPFTGRTRDFTSEGFYKYAVESEGDKVDNEKQANNDMKDTKSTISDDSDESGDLAFSGGQKQKLVMARSFMRQSDLAIFDEYSANLDPVAEHELFKQITVNRGKQTILYITHRFSTVKNADHILMLDKGKVIESGSHDELLAIPDGRYAEMYRLALGQGEADSKDTMVVKLDALTRDDDEDLRTLACNTPLPIDVSLTPTIPKLTDFPADTTLAPEVASA